MFLLEVMMQECPQLNDRAKRKAKGLALMWKNRTKKDNTNQAQVLGFLLLVAAFGLVSEFTFEDLVEYFYFVASSSRGPELCRGLGLGDGIPGKVFGRAFLLASALKLSCAHHHLSFLICFPGLGFWL